MELENYFRNKKILITGNTGFKGSWLSLWLLKMGAKVYGISDRIPTNPSMFEALGLIQKVSHQFIDLRDYQATEKAILQIRPDFVFHLAAQAIVSESYSDPLTTLTTNIMGTSHVLQAINKLDDKCVAVFITSDKCYENIEQVWGYRETDHLGGKDIYSASKGAAEIVIHAWYHSFIRDRRTNIRMASARAGNVIGGGDFSKDRIVPDCMKAWSENKKVVIRNPYSTRPWQHVLEPLSGYLSLAARLSKDPALNGESFNFGPNPDMNEKVLDIIGALSSLWGYPKVELAFEYVKPEHFHEAGLLKLNCDKALHYLRWQATLNFPQTMDLVCNWYKIFYTQQKDLFEFSLSQVNQFEQLAGKKGLKWAADIVNKEQD